MIIDAILDAKETNNFLDIEYIEEQARQFEFDDILEAITNKNSNDLKLALTRYIVNNNYNTMLIFDINEMIVLF